MFSVHCGQGYTQQDSIWLLIQPVRALNKHAGYITTYFQWSTFYSMQCNLFGAIFFCFCSFLCFLTFLRFFFVFLHFWLFLIFFLVFSRFSVDFHISDLLQEHVIEIKTFWSVFLFLDFFFSQNLIRLLKKRRIEHGCSQFHNLIFNWQIPSNCILLLWHLVDFFERTSAKALETYYIAMEKLFRCENCGSLEKSEKRYSSNNFST